MKFAFKIIVLQSLIVSSLAFAGNEADQFPKGPVLTETPGQLCSSPNSRRYAEKIAYCERNVDSYTKNAIIQKYDSLFGFHIKSMNRMDFKIDHLIPLCAGGANTAENLWPQHKSIYAITDPIEPLLCQKMLEGKLLQADAVKMIMEAKMNLAQAPVILKKLQKL